jgi:adenylate kinase family enzyme
VKRILVIGSGGAGKTAFSKQLGEILGLPVIHLDQLYWQPGWVKTEREEWVKKVDDLIAHPEWIIDGNFGGTLPQRIRRADTIILLDIPRIVCLWRVFKRTVTHYGRQRDEMPEGCPERFSWSFVRWIWNYPKKSKPAKLALLEKSSPEQRVVILGSNAHVHRFLAETKQEENLRALSARLTAR